MDKIYIKVDKKTGMVYLDNTVIGRDNENLQQKLIFSFENGFVSGSPRLEYKIANNKYHIPMEIDGENYKTPVKNILTKEGKVEMQLVVVQIAQNEEIPIFKSNVFYMYCNKSINAQEEAPDDYEYWLDVLEEKIVEMDEALDQVDNLNIDASKSENVATIEITNKDGLTKQVQILDGERGENGTDGQDGIDGITPTIGQNGNWYLGETDTGKPSRGVQGETGAPGQNGQDGIDGYTPIKGVDYFTPEDIANLNIPTKTSDLTNDSGFLTEHQDISGKLDTSKVKSSNSTTAGDVYDVTYINSMIGNIELLLGGI